MPWLTEEDSAPYKGKLNPVFSGSPPLTEEAEAPYKAKFIQFLEAFEWLLSDTHYVAKTPVPTIADIFAFSDLSSGIFESRDLSPYPNTQTWYSEIMQIPIVNELYESMLEATKKISLKE